MTHAGAEESQAERTGRTGATSADLEKGKTPPRVGGVSRRVGRLALLITG